MDERNAISRLKQGDLAGLETLVKQYQVRALHAAYLILFDRSSAEDVVQTAFIKAAERIHQFDESRPFGPWFFRIVINDAMKATRKRGRQVSLDEMADETTGWPGQWLADPNPGPEIWLEESEQRQSILDAVKRLPPDQRKAIVMKYFLDMRMSEMAEQTGRPLSTIKWWLRDARTRLRKSITNRNTS